MLRDRIGKELLFFDGGMGTLLQASGLKMGQPPEEWNITNKEDIKNIHKKYIEAGSQIILSNTFGANRLKFGDKLSDIVNSGVKNLKEAIAESGKKCYAALDIGPLGRLLYPSGDLRFDDAYDLFKEVCILGEKAGAELIVIETIGDISEARVAILAALENTKLPVICTFIFDDKKRLLTGADVVTMVNSIEGLGIDALGINCGLGPIQMEPIVNEILENTSLPVVVNPNAGLPKSVDGVTVFDITEDEFADSMRRMVEMGVSLIGGCCGTTPSYIEKTVKLCKDLPLKKVDVVKKSYITSYCKAKELGNGTVIIGERINPTGKKAFKEALIANNIDYILKEAVLQQDNGADILDVNVGLPQIDEVSMLGTAITEIQSVSDLPLQIDTSNIKAMEKALRYYNGRPLINSVNGKVESMEEVFPLVKKYGGVVVGLALDEDGIPETAEGRFKIAEKIVNHAKRYGIPPSDIVIDPLALPISTSEQSANVTLEAIRLIKERLKVKTILGVSNISFGLPNRENINTAFLAMAINYGLDCAIVNPLSRNITDTIFTAKAISGFDLGFETYIERNSNTKAISISKNDMTLFDSIVFGLKEEADQISGQMLDSGIKPLEVVNDHLIPALDKVGADFEVGKLFLPKLLMSAEAAGAAFNQVKKAIEKSGSVAEKKGKVVVATVKGDIHDIGKNIAKTLLDNYGYEVYDLGKDVPPQRVLDTARDKNIKLVGLSALMTTTVVSMEETIKLLREKLPDCKIMVGGAVLTYDYAMSINADHYSKDAMSSVNYAKEVLG